MQGKTKKCRKLANAKCENSFLFCFWPTFFVFFSFNFYHDKQIFKKSQKMGSDHRIMRQKSGFETKEDSQLLRHTFVL